MSGITWTRIDDSILIYPNILSIILIPEKIEKSSTLKNNSNISMLLDLVLLFKHYNFFRALADWTLFFIYLNNLFKMFNF